MDDKMKLILHNVQQNASCHQKYLKVLENHYHKISFEDFIKDFFKHLKRIFHMDIAIRNPYVERILEFLAQFVSLLTKPNEDETQVSLDENSVSHPFLTSVIHETLRFHDLAYVQTRYYSCRFITLILQHIGYETHLDNDICDSIQDSMLERILDPKASIRLQAVMALVRLQEPLNPDCPVIKAYLSLLVDANPLIRKEVVKRIAPNPITIPKISERIRDVDFHVRIAAYVRCADIGPKLFKIIARQQILKCGFHDNNKYVTKVFMESLLPKWLSAYNGDFLAFLSALKLDADENDIINTEEISKQVMEVFFKTVAIKEIIDALPIGEDKLIPVNNLTSEVMTYWNIVSNFLRSSEETEDYLDVIAPELTPFCNYIQSIIDLKTSKKMEEWEYLDYQYILYNLFEMAEQYDLSDEVGRRTFHKLVMSILQNHKLQFKLAKKVVSISEKLISNVDKLTNEMCQIISDIREPLVDKPATEYENVNNNFQIAELKVKINVLQGEIEDALDSQDFQKASVIQAELVEYKKKLEDLNKQIQIVKVRVAKDDPDTVCRCLDLLSALLELPSVDFISPSLATCKTEFLLPLLTSNIVEIHWRVLKCLALFCILDKNLAEEHTKVLCIPIATYRAIPNYNKFALMESVRTICDLMRVHGSELFGNEEDTANSTSQNGSTRRKLYRNEDMDDVTVMDPNRMNVEFIIEIILDMLDDENEEIRETAVTGISKLILTNFPVSPLLISRIILKWFNPLTEKAADKMQQKLGSLISNYTKLIKGAEEVIAKAVIPTLTSITSAPRTSPLADVDIDNVLRFLAALTNSNDTKKIVHIHTNLAHMLYYKIASKPKDPVVSYLTKMVLYLEIPPENSAAIKELITEFKLLLDEEEDGLEKGPRKFVMKFIEKLKASLKMDTIIEESVGDVEPNTKQTDNMNATTADENITGHTEKNADETINTRNRMIRNKSIANEGENKSLEDRNGSDKDKRDTENGGVEKLLGADNDTEDNEDVPKTKRPKRIRPRDVKNGHKINKNQAMEKNSSTETDSNSCNEERRSKRQRTHLNRCNATATKSLVAEKYNKIHTRNRATGDNNSTEVDTDSNGGEVIPLRQRRVLRQPDPGKYEKDSMGLRNNKNHNADSDANNKNKFRDKMSDKKRRNLNNIGRIEKMTSTVQKGSKESDMPTEETEKDGSRVLTRNLKRMRRGASKPTGVPQNGTTRRDKKVQNKIGNTESDATTTDVEKDTDGNTEVRRSKRPRRTMGKSNCVEGSKDIARSKKGNMNVKNKRVSAAVDILGRNGCSIQTRRPNERRGARSNLTMINSNVGQPIAESTRNNSHKTINNMTDSSSTNYSAEENINGMKTRKSRSEKSQDLDSSPDTTLHTIIEQSQRFSILEDDANFQTPTSDSTPRRSSRSRNTSVFSTPTTDSRKSKQSLTESSSESEFGSTASSVRRSVRKIKKKNMDNYVL